ncbi:MAG: MFS transporter [Rickettsiella sp.]|nr:MFS transporter [Rickettsiella sp.]
MIFTQEQKKIILLTGLGGALEFYDFIIFVFFAKTLGSLFFPSSDAIVSLLATYGLFAVGYLMRPLGGIILGHMGDRVGRKKTFLITIIGMAIPSLLIAVLPNYQTIGIFAPILLILLRLLQGFSVGGEIPGALVFITELTPTNNRALVCSLIFFGVNAGLLLGSLIATLLIHFMEPMTLLSWGWRLPFFIGGILGIFSFYLRRQLHETPLFLQLHIAKKQTLFPLKEVLLHHSLQIGQGVLLASLGAVIVSLFFLFMPTYLSTFFRYSFDKLMILNTLQMFLIGGLLVLLAYYADQLGYLKMIRIGTLGLLLLSYPIYSLFTLQKFGLVILGIFLLGGIGSIVMSTYTSILVSLFPTSVRYTGVGIVYNLGFAVAGGFTPLLVTWLIRFSDNRLIPAVYLMCFTGLAFLVSFFMREMRGIALGCDIL